MKEDPGAAEEDSELEDAGTDVDDDDGRKKPTVTNRLWFFAILIGGMAKKVSKKKTVENEGGKRCNILN